MGASESVGDIATVCQEVQAALDALQGEEHSENFTPLGGLVLAEDGPVETVAIEVGEAPPRTGASSDLPEAAISRDECESVRYKRQRRPCICMVHLKAAGPGVVLEGHIARVP